MNHVVAPAVEFVRGGGRAVLELEEGAIERVILWQLAQRFLGAVEDCFDFALEGFGERAVNVVVAIVNEHEAAVAKIPAEIRALLFGEAQHLVAGQIDEGIVGKLR